MAFLRGLAEAFLAQPAPVAAAPRASLPAQVMGLALALMLALTGGGLLMAAGVVALAHVLGPVWALAGAGAALFVLAFALLLIVKAARGTGRPPQTMPQAEAGQDQLLPRLGHLAAFALSHALLPKDGPIGQKKDTQQTV